MQTAADLSFWMPVIYLFIINIIAFFAMWWDKRKASQNAWRIAEATLHIIGFMGGALGIFGGMYKFRHKTQKRIFQGIAIVSLIVSLVIYWFIANMYI